MDSYEDVINEAVAKGMTLRDKSGKVITFIEYCDLKRDDSYAVVGHDVVWFQNQKAEVSTVWIGVGGSRNFDNGILFETMVFSTNHTYVVGRWESEEEAKTQHERAVAMLKKGKLP
jgi:hypothetical protein